jgi:hypothetical protein
VGEQRAGEPAPLELVGAERRRQRRLQCPQNLLLVDAGEPPVAHHYLAADDDGLDVDAAPAVEEGVQDRLSRSKNSTHESPM